MQVNHLKWEIQFNKIHTKLEFQNFKFMKSSKGGLLEPWMYFFIFFNDFAELVSDKRIKKIINIYCLESLFYREFFEFLYMLSSFFRNFFLIFVLNRNFIQAKTNYYILKKKIKSQLIFPIHIVYQFLLNFVGTLNILSLKDQSGNV